MRAECKALLMKSKKRRWCGDRRKWAEHRLMPGFDCMSKVCCHRDCIQCSKAGMVACLMSLPFHPSLPVSLIYLLCLFAVASNLMLEEHRSATLLECYTVSATWRMNLFTQKQCDTTTHLPNITFCRPLQDSKHHETDKPWMVFKIHFFITVSCYFCLFCDISSL